MATVDEQQLDNGADKASKKLLNGGVDPSVGKSTQIKPGQVLNPAGRPKGALSLSTHIQNMLNDEDFETWLPDVRDGFKEYKGAPVKAIIKTAMIKAMCGDVKAADWLAKYGYGTKVDITSGGERIHQAPIVLSSIEARLPDVPTKATEPATD